MPCRHRVVDEVQGEIGGSQDRKKKSRGDVSPRDYLTKLSLDAQPAGAGLLT